MTIYYLQCYWFIFVSKDSFNVFVQSDILPYVIEQDCFDNCSKNEILQQQQLIDG